MNMKASTAISAAAPNRASICVLAGRADQRASRPVPAGTSGVGAAVATALLMGGAVGAGVLPGSPPLLAATAPDMRARRPRKTHLIAPSVQGGGAYSDGVEKCHRTIP